MANVLRVKRAIVCVFAVVVAGCGSDRGAVREPASSAAIVAALTKAGWQARPVTGMPHTVSGAPQQFYLQTTAPDATQIDLQFFADSPLAAAERSAAQAKLPGFRATVVANAIAFSRGTGKRVLRADDVSALRHLLHDR